MISSSGVFGKGLMRPTVTELVPNSALVVLSKAFLLRLIGPDDPAVQRFIELACPHQPLTNPVVKTPAGD